MLVTINVPDSLPQEILRQRIRDIEEYLREEAESGMTESESSMSDDGDQEEDMRLFRESFGSWKDSRTAEEIIRDIRGSRKSAERNIRLCAGY
jgi:hypothetical protein